MNNKIYIGDSVYVSNDGYQLILTTENNGYASNTIYLEPHMIVLLQEYVDNLRKYAGNADDAKE